MVDRVILAMRASPDWGEFAQDYAAGIPVPATRYFPAHDLRFSRDVPRIIERWNELSPVSYFECRRRLRDIAEANLTKVERVIRVGWPGVPGVLEELDEASLLLFYLDDDDWFHPDLVDMCEEIDASSIDVAVFPYLRLAASVTTFTRGGQPTPHAVGRYEPFKYRYCTNNYGLTARALSSGASLLEHSSASQAGVDLGFVDLHVDEIVSATSKTPCSASWLPELPLEKDAFDRYIRTYIETLEALQIPSALAWVEAPLRETLVLFREVCSSSPSAAMRRPQVRSNA